MAMYEVSVRGDLENTIPYLWLMGDNVRLSGRVRMKGESPGIPTPAC